uniref:Wsv136-like protein n=1 Tax=Metapenaeus ensis nimavirus TaxID=2133794 RepID=A0A401IPA6_9VIRU|nr:MAG: wsv136-like protein [Metapenaeus ensis nimavirus]GBG35447.1 wsv136-like protein [Metapenaeus ensis nimavirus]
MATSENTPPLISFDIDDNEEKFTLSRRRAAIFLFFVGVTILTLLFIIRIDVDIKHGRIGERANIVERTTPLLQEPVDAALNGFSGPASALQPEGAANEDDTGHYYPRRVAVQENQRDPRMLLSSLFGSLYGRTDFLHK